jgi:hypothetical protein
MLESPGRRSFEPTLFYHHFGREMTVTKSKVTAGVFGLLVFFPSLTMAASEMVTIRNAAGQQVKVRRAHNYAECIKFGNTLGYTMDQRVSYCHQHFPN